MRPLFSLLMAILLLLCSCKLTESSLVGSYRPGKESRTRLILHPDHHFEFAFLDPRADSLLIPGMNGENAYTAGSWELQGKSLLLIADPTRSAQSSSLDDSISRFSSISSFHFWNRYEEPITIRYILLPPSRPKPHFGNSLYFFSQDFSSKDTLKFFFDGYPSVSYPGSIHHAIGNNIHKVTLEENYRPALFSELRLTARKNKLKSEELKFLLRKKK